MDDVASALWLTQESEPDELKALDQEIVALLIELESDPGLKWKEAQESTAIWQNGMMFKILFPIVD